MSVFRLIAVLSILLVSCKGGRSSSSETHAVLIQPSIKPLTEAIAADTTKADAWYRRALALHRIKEDSLALEDLYRAASIDTTKAEYASAIGDLLFEHKDVAGSVKWLQRALRHNPDDPKAHLKVAKLMLFAKDYPTAFSEINIVLRQDAYNPEGYYLKGLVYKELKDTSKAISSFRTALNVAPDYRDAAIQLGLLHSEQGEPLALQYLENAFKMDTSDVFPLYARGQYFQKRGDPEAAKAEYSRCISNNTQYADAYFATGYILLQQDSLEKARRQFDLVTRMEPTNAAAYYNRGLCAELLNDPTAAAADYRQALTFDKDYKTAAEGLKRVGN